MLTSCRLLKVVLTSRVRMSSLPELPEEIFVVPELGLPSSWHLFKSLTRTIAPDEI